MSEKYVLENTMVLKICRADLIWAMSWENLFMAYANNKGADQPAHPRSLISTCVVHVQVQYLYLLYAKFQDSS